MYKNLYAAWFRRSVLERNEVHGSCRLWGFDASIGAYCPEPALACRESLKKRLLPGSPFDNPEVIAKKIFLVPFFTGNLPENLEFFELVDQIIGRLVTDAKC
jgi:hypothetical protein